MGDGVSHGQETAGPQPEAKTNPESPVTQSSRRRFLEAIGRPFSEAASALRVATDNAESNGVKPES